MITQIIVTKYWNTPEMSSFQELAYRLKTFFRGTEKHGVL